MTIFNPLINELGNIKERIDDNPTSERLFTAADYCLYEAAELVLQTTYLYQEVLGVYFSTYTRKKLSNIKEDKLNQLIVRFYNCKPEEQIVLLREMKLNRELVVLPIQMMSEKLEEYCHCLASGKYQTFNIRNNLMCKNINEDISLQLLKIRAAYDRYEYIKESIMEKFYRLIVRDIGRYSKLVKDRINLEDMAVEYYASLMRAFSKFDTSSGAFTSYLQSWFKNAKATSMSTDEIGVAYNIPHNIRVRLAKGEDLDIYNYNVVGGADNFIENTLDKIYHNDEMKLIRNIISSCDHNGLYQLLNDVEMDIQKYINIPK